MSFAEGTSVPVSKTRAEIEALAQRYGASMFTSGWLGDKASVSFAGGRLVRFVLAMPTMEEAKKKRPRRYSWQTPTEAQQKAWVEAETRRRWRCLLLSIKAKLECVETGIATFDEEFLAYVVTGRDMTIYEVIKSQPNGMKLLEATPGPVDPDYTAPGAR